jgi:uncharacterized protein
MIYLWTALSLGLVSNFHCLGMCGPIALAIPVKSNTISSRLGSILLYNLGRISTYALIGAIFGFFGKGLFLMGIQQQLSIVIGALIVASAILILANRKVDLFSKIIPSKFVVLKSKMQKYLRQKGYFNNFILGLLNGILPCGVVYFALMGALATGGVVSGILFMTLFGVGTLPVMVLLPWIKDYLTTGFRQKLQRTVPVMLLIFGSLLIVRGANLGIPYLSPKVEKAKTTITDNEPQKEECTVKCCH